MRKRPQATIIINLFNFPVNFKTWRLLKANFKTWRLTRDGNQLGPNKNGATEPARRKQVTLLAPISVFLKEKKLFKLSVLYR